MRYFAELSYAGTLYNGWQRQKDVSTIQGTIEDALSKRLRTETTLTGAGRTDTGVHSMYYVAHFDSDQLSGEESSDFTVRLNTMLPKDIVVHSITEVAQEAHARYDAVEREYQYFIRQARDPFLRDFTSYYYGTLDTGAMNSAANFLLGKKEFTTFSKLHSANKTDTCTVSHASWERANGSTLVFTIRADRFLRNMVRSIVGTLLDVGRGKISPERFSEIMASQDRAFASGSAPAQGLFLTDIKYPDTVFTRQCRIDSIF